VKAPDVNKHFIISIVKSAIRISSCIVAIQFNTWQILAIGFVVAEILGVVEEIL